MKRFPRTVSLLFASAVLMGSHSLSAQSTNAAAPGDGYSEHDSYFNNLMERFSYAYGADLAETFKLEGIELNVDLFAEAMKAVLAGEESKMPADEVAATIEIFRGVHTQKRQTEWAAAAEKNQEQGEAFLSENAGKEGVNTTESGLQYRIIAEGSGEYTPTEADNVIVHYRGSFIDGTEFDSTYSRNAPFRGMPQQLIEGWSEALQMMSEGAKWELVIPAHLAYGEEGSQPNIGPNAVLLFEVELLGVERAELSFAEP